MSESMVVLAVVAVWVLIGVGLALLMGRRGHEPFSWALLGAMLGPLAIVLAIEASTREHDAAPRLLMAGTPEQGPVDVVVGLDGSTESRAALMTALDLLGPRLGRLTLVSVVDYDAGLDAAERDSEKRAVAELERQAALLSRHSPRVELLVGRAAEILPRFAAEGGYDLLVVGHRGRGRSHAFLGSVATALSANGSVPTLVAGQGSHRDGEERAAEEVEVSPGKRGGGQPDVEPQPEPG